jgi:hypothetical protein
MARLVGEKPRPRMLVMGIPDGDDSRGIRQALEALVPTVRFVDAWQFQLLRQLEWDFVFIFGNSPVQLLEPHLFVIQIGGSTGILLPMDAPSILSAHYTTQAEEFQIPDNLPEKVSALVHTDLLPAAQMASDGNPYMHTSYVIAAKKTPLATPVRRVRPFLMDGDGKPLAGIVNRSDKVEYWWIPFRAETVLNWMTSLGLV